MPAIPASIPASTHVNAIVRPTSMPATAASVRSPASERPERHEVAVGEVDEPQDPVDDRHPDGRDRDHRTGHEPVGKELREHLLVPPLRTSLATEPGSPGLRTRFESFDLPPH